MCDWTVDDFKYGVRGWCWCMTVQWVISSMVLEAGVGV